MNLMKEVEKDDLTIEGIIYKVFKLPEEVVFSYRLEGTNDHYHLLRNVKNTDVLYVVDINDRVSFVLGGHTITDDTDGELRVICPKFCTCQE